MTPPSSAGWLSGWRGQGSNPEEHRKRLITHEEEEEPIGDELKQPIRSLVHLRADGGAVHGGDVSQDFLHQHLRSIGRLCERWREVGRADGS